MHPLTITYRVAGPEDKPVLTEMLYHALYVPEGTPPLPRAIINQPEIAVYVSGWGRKDDRGWIAYDGTNPVGAAWIRLMRGSEKGYGYVNEKTPELSMALLPFYRGRGIGTELLRRVLEDASAMFPAVCLSVSAENPAVHLYTRNGFTICRDSGQSLTMIRNY